VATIENVQQQAGVTGQQAAISAAKTDIAAYCRGKDRRSQRREGQGRPGAETAGLGARPEPLQGRHSGQAGFDAKKAAYDTDVAALNQAVAALNQARAQTESQRGTWEPRWPPCAPTRMLLDLTMAVAPFDGIVTNEPVREGETVVEGIQNTEGSTFMTLADMSVVTAEVKVDETDIVNIRIGQEAEVTVDALPGKVFKGHVTLAGDQALLRSTGMATLQSTTGTEEAKDFKVIVTLDAPTSDLRPGLSTTAKITTAHKQNVLTLPIQALTMYTPEAS
jgi:HlyD family secretion protein